MFWQFPVHSWYWYYWFVSSTSHKYIILTFPLYSWRWHYEYISTTRYTDIILTFPVYSWCWYYEYISTTRLSDIYWYFPSLVIWTFPVVDLTSNVMEKMFRISSWDGNIFKKLCCDWRVAGCRGKYWRPGPSKNNITFKNFCQL